MGTGKTAASVAHSPLTNTPIAVAFVYGSDVMDEGV